MFEKFLFAWDYFLSSLFIAPVKAWTACILMRILTALVLTITRLQHEFGNRVGEFCSDVNNHLGQTLSWIMFRHHLTAFGETNKPSLLIEIPSHTGGASNLQISDAKPSSPFSFIRILLSKRRDSKKKLNSLHTPEVNCISKGKSHRRYEFGCKVGLVSAVKERFYCWSTCFHITISR